MSNPAPAPPRAPRSTSGGRGASSAHATVVAPVERDAPQLRVVEAVPARTRAGRRTPVGALGAVLVGCLFIAVFGMVVFQALLAQTQSRLDGLDTQVSTQEGRARDLERQRADLESPDRIVAEAKRLDMVPPPEVIHLEPGSLDDEQARYDPNAPAPKPVTPTTKAPPVTAAPPVTTPTTVATTPTSKAGTATTKAPASTTPTTKAGAKATTPTTKATTPTTKAGTATTRATGGR